MILGQTIREARNQKGMTLRELSQKPGINLVTLSNIERDKRATSADLLRRVSEVLGLDEDDLRTKAGILSEEERSYIRRNPKAPALIRKMMGLGYGEQETKRLMVLVLPLQGRK